MRTSTTSRILSALLGLVLTPIGIGLLTTGGMIWYRFSMIMSYDFDPIVIAGPLLQQALGLMMLAVVVLSGIWSSAGLLAVGVHALFSLVVGMFPALAIELIGAFGSVLPREWFDSLTFGTPLPVATALFGMGLVLFLIRRRQQQPAPGAAVGAAIGAPVALFIGGFLLAWGTGAGLLLAMQRFQAEPNLGVLAGVLVGSLLLLAGVLATLWSRWALVLPGAVMLILSLLYLVPDVNLLVYRSLPRDAGHGLMIFFVLGAGTAVGLAYVLFTLVVAIVRRRTQGGPAPAQGYEGYGMPQPYAAAPGAHGGPQHPYPGQQQPGPAPYPQLYPGQPYPGQSYPGQSAPQHPPYPPA